MRNKKLFKIGLYCGLIPLLGGLFIFFTWWIARAFFAIDLNSFEKLGFFWIFVSIPIAFIGIILITTYFIKNYPKDFTKPILGMIIILANILVVNWVVDKQSNLNERAYVKIYNNGDFSLKNLELKGFYFGAKIGTIDSKASTVIYFYPPNYDPSDGFPPIDTVRIVGQVNSQNINIVTRLIERGECKRFSIDKEFKLHEK